MIDLEKRTTDFSRTVIRLCKEVKINRLNDSIVDQLIRSSTSIGTNYFEANGASSKKDFKNKIHLCKKEAKETTYWLNLIDEFSTSEELSKIRQEAHELLLIFSKIAASSK